MSLDVPSSQDGDKGAMAEISGRFVTRGRPEMFIKKMFYQ